MRLSVRPIALLATVLLPIACRDGGITGPYTTRLSRELTASEQHLIAADNALAFKLYGALAARESPDSNIFISPLSVGMALGMTVNGAAGATRDSMLAALQLAGAPMADVNASYRSVIDLLRGLDPGVDFTLANSIWYRSTFQTPGQAFLNDTRTYFDAQVQGLDFSAPTAAQTINDWVNGQTRGKIPDIVDAPIDPAVVMFLINAIYFKGSWTQKFDASLTKASPFTLRSGAAVTASMMTHAEPAPLRLYMDREVTVVDLPYGGGAYAMTIVLPRAPATIDSLSANLTEDRWDAWIAGLDSTRAIVTMPKFKLTFERGLEPPLTDLGMGITFCPSPVSDFSGMYPGAAPGDFCISSVRHKTYVDVYEEGTEAAAVTSVGIDLSSAGPMPIVVDHPFIVAIRERLTGTILFLGRVMNPVGS
ncbi:MAG: serpin family protein [Gemmatimonadales bacterium]|jgi:serpin B